MEGSRESCLGASDMFDHHCRRVLAAGERKDGRSACPSRDEYVIVAIISMTLVAGAGIAPVRLIETLLA